MFGTHSFILLSLLSLTTVFCAANPLQLKRDRDDSGCKIATAWYPGWLSADFPPSAINWRDYTHMTYAFVVTGNDVNSADVSEADSPVLSELVRSARANNVKSMISVGGWTGSAYFSPAVATAENRTAFVNALVKLAVKYKVDGLDFDWEYPNREGNDGNIIAPNDTANFLLLLQELRKTEVGSKLTLSAAVTIVPYNGPDGQPLKSMAGFAKVLDFIALMAYDIWGPWTPTVGPNAPAYDSCASAPNQGGSGESAIKAWRDAGIPADQLVLGVPSYAHLYYVKPKDAFIPGSTKKLALYPPFNTSLPKGDKWNQGPDDTPDQYSGIYDYRGFIENNLLYPDSSPVEGIVRTFDKCSQTPFLYDPKTNVYYAYDDPQSFAAKGKLIRKTGIAGFAMWDATGDYQGDLVHALKSAEYGVRRGKYDNVDRKQSAWRKHNRFIPGARKRRH